MTQPDDTAPSDLDDTDLAGTDLDESSLFRGDVGTLSSVERRALVALMKKSYLSAVDTPAEWATLIESEARIRSRLHDMYLDLIIDFDLEFAFKWQLRALDADFPTLLRSQTYSREVTIILVTLRQRLLNARTGAADGEMKLEAFVDADELVEFVSHYRPESDTNAARGATAATNAIDTIVKLGVLHRTSETGRYRISPVIDMLLPIDKLKELATWLRQQDESAAQVLDRPAHAEPQEGQVD